MNRSKTLYLKDQKIYFICNGTSTNKVIDSINSYINTETSFFSSFFSKKTNNIEKIKHEEFPRLENIGIKETSLCKEYIDDNLEPLWKSAILPEASNQIINLGGIEEISINEACKTLQEVIGGGEIVHKEARHEVKHSIPTYQKSIDILGYEYKTNLKEGLTEMWKWAQHQPMRDRFVWSSYELDKGIYSFWKV